MKLLLIEWDVDAASLRAAELEEGGHVVIVEVDDGGRACRIARSEQPDVILLDLANRPSHSWQTARPLAPRYQSRLVFIDGSSEAQEKARAIAPGAIFTTSEHVLDVLATNTW